MNDDKGLSNWDVFSHIPGQVMSNLYYSNYFLALGDEKDYTLQIAKHKIDICYESHARKLGLISSIGSASRQASLLE